MTRKSVLILGHNYATQFIDIYNEYFRLFDESRYEVTVAFLTGTPDEIVKSRMQTKNIVFLNIPNKKLRGLKIGAIHQLLQLTKQKKFEIVVCHRYKASYIMMWVAQFYRLRALVCVMHELKTMASFGRKFILAALRRGNMLFAGVSNAVRDDMRKDLWFIPKNRIVTLYNMIDVDFIEPQLFSREEARNKLAITPDTFLFGNIARLAPNKDQYTLINAFARIKPACPRAKLIIIGDGSLEATLKQQIVTLSLTDDVILTGFIPGGFRYMKAFDCFTLSSTQEAFGRVLLEAMIARIPIIATKANGIPEVTGDVATLIQPKDTMKLAEAMKAIYLSHDEDRQQQGNNGYQRVNHHFSIPEFYKQFWQQPLLATIKD